MNVIRHLRLLSRHHRRYPASLQISTYSPLERTLGSYRADAADGGPLCPAGRPPCRPFSDNETDEAASLLEDDSDEEQEDVRVRLYPDSEDPVLRALDRTTSAEDVFTVLGESAEPRHLCQAVVSLWDLHKLTPAPGPLPAGDYRRLMEALLRRADHCDDLALVCTLYCVVRLEGPGWRQAQTRLEELCTARLPRLSLAALSRLGVCLQLRDSSRPWPPRLVQPYLRSLAAHSASCRSWAELRLLATAALSAHTYLSAEAERRFSLLLRRFSSEREVGPEEADAVLKLVKVLNERGLRPWLAPVCRQLASLYVRAEPRPAAAAAGLLGTALLRLRQAPPAVERLLAERAAQLLADQRPVQLPLLETAAPSRLLPDWLRHRLLEDARSSLQSVESRLAAPGGLSERSARVSLSTELQRARHLVSALRPAPPAEHRRLWRLSLRALRRPDAWLGSEESAARRHALAYFGHMAQLPASCGLPELEAELLTVLERHSRRLLVATNRLVEALSFLLAYGGRPLAGDLQQRLLALAERDQLSTHRIGRLSRAIQIGRSQIQRQPGPQSTEQLHQLTQLTIALNSATLRLLPAVTSIEAAVWLAGAALRRRGVVAGNTAVLEACLARLHQLTESDQLSSRAADKLAGCLEAARYADDATMDLLCRHVLEHRDHVSGVVAERVLSAAFRTGHWPADSAAFEDFLAAAADIVSRSLYRLTAEATLRACQALCLYGQLPAQLARTVLGQAFLDKTERQIQLLLEQTAAEPRGGSVGPGGGRRSVQTPATRLRRLQMEVNRAVRLNMPDQSVPWFTDVYAKGLPDPQAGAAHRRLVSEVRDALSALAGGSDRVHSGVRTAGYQFTADLLLYRRPDGSFTDTDGPRVTSVAVLVPSAQDYCINRRQLTGAQLLRRRHLEMLGFSVCTVHPHHWNSMALAEPADRLQFLAALLRGRNLLQERP